MATKFYLPHNTGLGTAPISPAFSTEWGVTGSAERAALLLTSGQTAITSKTTASNTSVAWVLNRQYISAPLAAQTISGTISGQVRGNSSNAAAVHSSAVSVRYLSNDGTTIRGTGLPIGSGSSAFTTTLTNRITPTGTTLTNVAVSEGDRIVIEIGARQNASSSNRTATQSFGNNAASDLAFEQTGTAALNPWISFSSNIKFLNSGTINGTARILEVNTNTQSGVAKISSTVSFTESGKSRISASITNTMAGKASLLNAHVATQLGVARVQTSDTNTQSGKSRIQILSTGTITGKSRVLNSVVNTKTGLARIQNAITNTRTGTARIQTSNANTKTGLARIRVSITSAITGKSNITSASNPTKTATITGVANIFVTFTLINIQIQGLIPYRSGSPALIK